MAKEASSNKSVTKKGKNFMWSNRKDQFLLTFLADCAKNGEKHGKLFKGPTLEKAAKAVSEKFDEICTSTNVDSRLKTVRKKYGHIKTLRERSGWAWDEELKMIKVDKDEALAFIEVFFSVIYQ